MIQQMDVQTYEQMVRQTNIQTDRQVNIDIWTDLQTDGCKTLKPSGTLMLRQMFGQTGIQTNGWSYRQTETFQKLGIPTHGCSNTQTYSQTVGKKDVCLDQQIFRQMDKICRQAP